MLGVQQEMICIIKGCNKETEFDLDCWCNYHWRQKNES